MATITMGPMFLDEPAQHVVLIAKHALTAPIVPYAGITSTFWHQQYPSSQNRTSGAMESGYSIWTTTKLATAIARPAIFTMEPDQILDELALRARKTACFAVTRQIAPSAGTARTSTKGIAWPVARRQMATSTMAVASGEGRF